MSKVLRFTLFLFSLQFWFATGLIAQSPNTASMIVVVSDQAGGVVKDANVAVVNTATGDTREATSGSDGISASFCS